MKLFKGRTLRRFEEGCTCQSYYCTHDRVLVTNPGEADLVSSDVDGGGYHLPVLDLDVPAQLVPSATPGHSHLYIDVRMPWDKYEALLLALAEAGIVERGFADASLRRGFSSVRVPWKPKGL